MAIQVFSTFFIGRYIYFMKNFTILSDLHITILRPIIMQLSSMIVHIFFASFLILELEVPILWEQLTDTHRRPIVVCTLQNMKVMLNEMTQSNTSFAIILQYENPCKRQFYFLIFDFLVLFADIETGNYISGKKLLAVFFEKKTLYDLVYDKRIKLHFVFHFNLILKSECKTLGRIPFF